MKPSCYTCGTAKIRYACGTCANYAFCSHECSDAVAEEHHATCTHVDADASMEFGASLATWKSYTPMQLSQKVEMFLRNFKSTAGKPKQRWLLKQVHGREIRSILAALDAKLALSNMSPSVQSQLEVLRNRVAGL